MVPGSLAQMTLTGPTQSVREKKLKRQKNIKSYRENVKREKKLQLKQFTCRPAAIIGKHKFFNNCLMVVVLDGRPNVRFAEAKTAGSTSRVMANIHPRRRRRKNILAKQMRMYVSRLSIARKIETNHDNYIQTKRRPFYHETEVNIHPSIKFSTCSVLFGSLYFS